MHSENLRGVETKNLKGASFKLLKVNHNHNFVVLAIGMHTQNMDLVCVLENGVPMSLT
jgi:hypothetical protein